MSIKINLSNMKMSGESKASLETTLCNSYEDVQIDAPNMELTDRAVFSENLKIGATLDQLTQKAVLLDKSSREYADIQKILSIPRSNEKEISKHIARHIAEFAQGVLASIVASLLT